MHAELMLLWLMVAGAGLSVLARPLGVPYPILLVLGGLLLGFVPGVSAVQLPPELVLVLFLPPLLYQAAFFSSRATCAPTCAPSRCWRSGWCWSPWWRWR
jgi:NhaP-type Na+/H+ or K+/H+ antiporter